MVETPDGLELAEPLQGWDEHARYVECDLCGHTAREDIWADRPWREFYRAPSTCGLVVCEACVPKWQAWHQPQPDAVVEGRP